MLDFNHTCLYDCLSVSVASRHGDRLHNSFNFCLIVCQLSNLLGVWRYYYFVNSIVPGETDLRAAARVALQA